MQLKKTKVLICENSELLSLGLKSLIEQSNAFEALDSICDEEDLLNFAESSRPGVVFIDMNSVKPDSIGVLSKSLKELLPDTKVLIFGMSGGDRGFAEFLRSGADGFCLRESSGSNILLALHSLDTGAVWIDRNASKFFKEKIKETSAEPASACHCNRNCLSIRETEVLICIMEGCSNREIAMKLQLSQETVKTHIKHIFEKLSVKHRTEAVMEGLKRGLITAA